MPSSSNRSQHPPMPAPPTPPPPSNAQQQAAGLGFGGMLPNAAHQADLVLINELVNQLAEVNAENRRKTEEVTRMCERLALQHDEWVAADPEIQRQMGVHSVPKAELERTENLLKQSETIRRSLANTVEGLTEVQADYEEVMENTLVRVREFSHAHTDTLLKWHRHYNDIIQKLRDENLQIRLEHSAWQERLGKVNEYVRKAYALLSEWELPYLTKIAEVKRENKVLRRLCNMELKIWDTDDEIEAQEEEHEEIERRLREMQLAAQTTHDSDLMPSSSAGANPSAEAIASADHELSRAVGELSTVLGEQGDPITEDSV